MPPNTRNNRFAFGFLNDNQDPVDIGDNESPLLDSLDADAMALGTMQVSSYIDPSSGPKDWSGDTTQVKLGGRRFRLHPTTNRLQFEKNAGSEDWEYVNNDPDETGASNSSAFPPKGTSPSLSSVKGVSITPASGSTDIPSIDFRINPSTGYTGLETESYVIEIDAAAGDASTFRWKFGFDTTWRASGVAINPGTWISLWTNGFQVNFPTDAQQVIDTGGSYAVGDDASTTVSKTVLPDGPYSYIIVNVKRTSLDPEVDIQGLPSDPVNANLANVTDAGVPITNGPLVTEITYPSMPSNTDEMWLFRKGPDDDEFFRIDIATAGSKVITDTIETVGLVPLIILDSTDDEAFYDLNLAVGNGSQEFVKLFEKDNRLWLVPDDRQDLVLYSRLGDWWGWQRVNSFALVGDITDLAQVRDPTTVGGEFTTVFGTDEGIFHITGNGTENAPYTLVQAERDINVEANSLVDMNGVLMLMSKSPNGDYDEGRFGQKIYEYNLQSLIEVSARVKNSNLISSTAGVEYAEMRGSDKYLVKKTGVDELLLYHRDVQGWMQVTSNGETNGWSWRSKKFTPEVYKRMPLAYARFVKLDFVGQLIMTFTLEGVDTASPVVRTLDVTHGTRKELYQRLPAVKGHKWYLDLTTGDATTVLYDLYYVT